jgi:hypothetical protein
VPDPARFLRLVDALTTAAPIALATHFDEPNQCILASSAGAAILRASGVRASAAPCSLLASRNGVGVGLGMEPPPPDGPGEVHDLVPEGTPRVHAVIRARSGRHHATIDLTIGHLRSLGVDVPISLTITHAYDGWPSEMYAGWLLQYEDSASVAEARKLIAKADTIAAFREDLAELVRASLALDNDFHRLALTLWRQSPDLMRVVIPRIERWLEIRTPSLPVAN